MKRNRLINPKIESYSLSHSSPESPLLKKIRKATRDGGWPAMHIDPTEGQLLKTLIKISKAKHILEIGTFTGYSALAMAEVLPKTGKVITLDYHPQTTAIAQKHWRQSSHGNKIELMLGDATKTITQLVGKFDLVFIDADKRNYINYWKLCVPKLKKGGIMIIDNIFMRGGVLQPKTPQDRAIREFNELVAKDKRFAKVVLPIRDGITIAYKL